MPPFTEEITLAGAIRRYFDVVLYLLIFTGFGSLASTGRIDLATVLVVISALLYPGYLLVRHRQVLLFERWTNILTIACVGFYILDDFLISRAFLGATVHLVLFVMLVRLFSAQRDRHHYFLAVLSFLMVLAAAVLSVDSTFLIALAGFILLAVAAFVLMEMMHSLKMSSVLARDPRVQHAHRKLSFAILGVAPVLLMLIFLGGTGIFFLLPRVSAGFMNAESGANDITTGFSDHVELGRIGQIQQSKTVVMHVAIDGDSFGAFAPKLRGVALSNFDGRSWSNRSDRQPIFRGPDGRFNLELRNIKFGATRGHNLHYRVIMEPFITEVFFLLATPESLAGNYRAVSENLDGSVFNMDNEHPVSRYEAESQISTPTARLQSTSDVFPGHVSSEYLRLPELDSRI